MRILFLTDSLSLPRGEKEEFIGFEETYVNLVKAEFKNFTIADSAIGGATILDLYKQIFYYKNFKPDLVILHCGIVDCAPRAWRSFGRKLLSILGLKLNGLTRFMRKYRGLRMTSKGKFEKISKQIRTEFKDIPVYAIGILPASTNYEKNVPGIIKSITEYNEILERHFKLIDNKDFPFDGILSDHHHLNKKGHQLLADKLKVILTAEISKSK